MSPNAKAFTIIGTTFVGTCVLVTFVGLAHQVAVIVGTICPLILWALLTWKVAGWADKTNAMNSEVAARKRRQQEARDG